MTGPKRLEGRAANVETAANPPSNAPARLLIAEDHALVREGLLAMLANEPDLAVVGEAENGLKAVEACRALEPDLVLMDVRMPEMDGLQATRVIKEAQPRTSVLMVTTHRDPDYLMEAVRAGAAGYVLKESSKKELLEAVRKVLGGEVTLDSGLAARLIARFSHEPAPEKEEEEESVPQTAPGSGPEGRREAGSEGAASERLGGLLSGREVDVLRLMAAGKTNRQIAQDRIVSLSTVKTHVERIIRKLGVSDRTQASVKAMELGLLPKPE